jgi:hypothetical protein
VIKKEQAAKISRMDLDALACLKKADALQTYWIKKHSDHNLSIAEEWREMESLLRK